MNDALQKDVSNEQLIRWFTPDSSKYTAAIGCSQCPQQRVCGGLHVKGSLMDCHDLCCGSPDRCTLACKNRAAEYVDQVREVGGFEFDDIQASPSVPISLPNGVVPFIYHGYCRSEPLNADLVALSLSDLIDFRKKQLKYTTARALRAAFRLKQGTRIIVSGIDHDAEIERWWRLGEKREALIQGMKHLDIDLITTPNYSVALDSPRFNDLHSLKRIALNNAEFSQAGIASALHTHGRTDHDFVRWGEYLRAHPEIEVLAYEFTTGSGRRDRLKFHIEQLSHVRRIADRPLSIVARGNINCIPGLREIFEIVTYLESNSFMRSIKRKEAYISNRNKLKWRACQTVSGEPIDHLLYRNSSSVKKYIEEQYFKADRPMDMAA